MKACQGIQGGKACKQMKGNASADRTSPKYTDKSSPVCSPLTLAVFGGVMCFCMLAMGAQLQQAAVYLQEKQRQEEELERILTQKTIMVAELQAEKLRLETEQQRGTIGLEPTSHTCTQTEDCSEACPVEAAVVVELKLSCSRMGSMSTKDAPTPSSDAIKKGCPAESSSHERRSSGGFSDDVSVHVSAEAVVSMQLKKCSTFSKLKKPFKAASKKCLAKLTQAFTPAKASNSSTVPTRFVRATSAITSFFKLGCLRPHVHDE